MYHQNTMYIYPLHVQHAETNSQLPGTKYGEGGENGRDCMIPKKNKGVCVEPSNAGERCGRRAYFLPLFLMPWPPVFRGPLPPAFLAISSRAFLSAKRGQR